MYDCIGAIPLLWSEILCKRSLSGVRGFVCAFDGSVTHRKSIVYHHTLYNIILCSYIRQIMIVDILNLLVKSMNERD
jgi:hypothetical protein